MMTRRGLLVGSVGLTAALAGCGADQDAAPQAGTRETPGPPSSAAPPTSAAPTSPSTSPSPTATPSATGSPRPRVAETLAEGLDVPWGLAFLPSGDALVSARNSGALVRVSRDGGRTTTLGEVAGVAAPSGSGEGGLLGIALDPADPDTLYAYLSTSDDNRVVRVDVRGGRVRRPLPVLTGIPRGTYHNGGRLLFDGGGRLYVSTGDAERPALAQDRDSLAGKILRLRTDGRAAAGNPYGNRTWSYGHRNVQGLALDADGRLWATEFGDKRADELNLVGEGDNYGWPRVEGEGGGSRYAQPAVTWSPTSTCSPAGLAIARSTAFVAALQGRCLFAVPLRGRSAGRARRYFADDHGRIRTVAVAPDGSLWMTTSNTDGRTDPGRRDDRVLRVTL